MQQLVNRKGTGSPIFILKKRSLGSLLGKRAVRAAMLTDEQKIEEEMTMYLQEIAIDGEEDPLIWWKTNEKGLMARLSHKYLCICGTSTPLERFSAPPVV